jgi:hypothetical protein
MKKMGARPHILFVVGSLALALTACSDGNNTTLTYINPESVTEFLTGQGYAPTETPGSYTSPDGTLVSEEEALRRTGRRTIRRGFGRIFFGVGFGG